MSKLRGSAALLAVAVALLVSANAWAGVYKWIDENGVAHYTLDADEIPAHLRRRLRPSGDRTAVPPEAAPLAGAPVLIDRRPGAPLSLTEQIERDREAIKEMISREGQTGLELAEDPELKKISERLPRLQSEYQQTQRERQE